MADYLRDPDSIYARSFAIIRAEVPLERFPAPLHAMVLRLVHACGMPDIADALVWSGDPATAGRAALEAGAAVLGDAHEAHREGEDRSRAFRPDAQPVEEMEKG
ncbi:MAG: precorrin-8X methylmutase, partial [Geminicoccaceae bacterium]